MSNKRTSLDEDIHGSWAPSDEVYRELARLHQRDGEIVRAPMPEKFRIAPMADTQGRRIEKKHEEGTSFPLEAFPARTLLDWKPFLETFCPVIFVRGLPGVGKTTFAHTCFPTKRLFEADLFAEQAAPGNFAERHALCRQSLQYHLATSHEGAIVCNTFTQQWELMSYLKDLDVIMQESVIIPIVIHLHPGDLDDATLAQRTQHSVPERHIALMRNRWESWPGEIMSAYGCASSSRGIHA